MSISNTMMLSSGESGFLKCRGLGLMLAPMSLVTTIVGVVILATTEQQAVSAWNGRRYDKSHRVFAQDCQTSDDANNKLVTMSHCPFDVPGQPRLLQSLFQQMFPTELDKPTVVSMENPLYHPVRSPNTLTYSRVTELKVYEKRAGKWTAEWVQLTNTDLPAPLSSEELTECRAALANENCVNEDPAQIPSILFNEQKKVAVADLLIGGQGVKVQRNRKGFALTCDDYKGEGDDISNCPIMGMVNDEELTESTVQTMQFQAPQGQGKSSTIFYTKCETDTNETASCTSSKYLYLNLYAFTGTGFFNESMLTQGRIGAYRFSAGYRNLVNKLTITGLAKQVKIGNQHRLMPWENSQTKQLYSQFYMERDDGERVDPFSDLYHSSTQRSSGKALLWALRFLGWFVLWLGAHLFLCLMIYISLGEGRMLSMIPTPFPSFQYKFIYIFPFIFTQITTITTTTTTQAGSATCAGSPPPLCCCTETWSRCV